MTAKYVADNKTFAALMVSPDMHALSKHFAAEAKAYAVAIAPDRPPLGKGYVAELRDRG